MKYSMDNGKLQSKDLTPLVIRFGCLTPLMFQGQDMAAAEN